MDEGQLPAAAGATVLTVVGARPQFVKAATVSPALRRVGLREILVHTGQHYDYEMSAAFFEGLGIPAPDHNLQVGSGPHGAQTGRMLEALEQVCQQEHPDLVLVYGDTNSTMAGALAAAKLDIPVAHVEAGLRSFDRRMPEEINRVVTDHLAAILFAPTATAMANLANEGLADAAVRTGDVMFDLVVAHRAAIFAAVGPVLARFGVAEQGFAFATVHRPENTDDAAHWAGILQAFRRLAAEGLPIIWAAHPRTRRLVEELAIPGVQIAPPLPYLQTQALLRSARVVLTDSGGLVKEAAFHGTPCLTLRNTTEWTELVEVGVNWLAGADPGRIVPLALQAAWPVAGLPLELYGDGDTATAIAGALGAFLARRGAIDASRSAATGARP